MKKSLTLFTYLICCVVGLETQAQNGKSKEKLQSNDSKPNQQHLTKQQTNNNNSTVAIITPQMLAYLNPQQEELNKNYKKVAENIYTCNHCGEKLKEIRQEVANKNDAQDPIEVLTTALPKFKITGDFDTDFSQYRLELVELFQKYPDYKESLGQKFIQNFDKTEYFRELMKAAYDKGYNNK